ncbi:MAG: head decoration protein [Rhodospirillaceae bacterium]|nr:head decoration protein [Rhodospirillaceae bacterium]
MPSVTETMHPGEFLISEAAGNRSREKVTVLSGQNLKAGHVLGAVLTALTVAAPVFAGTGNGAITMDATTPVLASAKVGAYTATCVTAATNGGTFRVEDPDGFVLGDVAVGATFADDIKFVIADGSTDFVVGDKFTITVTAGSSKVRELNLTGIDGSEKAYGVLWDAIDASAADVAGAAIVRDAEVDANDLTWPSGITTNQKNAAIAQLATRGIIVRS